MSDIFAYEFMRNAFAATTIVGLVAGAIGYFLVLRREVFAGHALAHVGFPGATGAALVGLPPLFGLGLMSALAGLGIAWFGGRAHRDVAIGIVLAFSLGLGLLFLHFYTAYAGMATSLLFGDVLAISVSTLWALLGIGAAALLGLAVIARPLIFASLEPELARAQGVPVGLVSALFMLIAALATAEAIQIVGILLVFALMVAPAATAVAVAHRVRTGLLLSVGLALCVAWAGLLLAYATDWPTSFWISALGALAFLLGQGVRRLRPRQKLRPA